MGSTYSIFINYISKNFLEVCKFRGSAENFVLLKKAQKSYKHFANNINAMY